MNLKPEFNVNIKKLIDLESDEIREKRLTVCLNSQILSNSIHELSFTPYYKWNLKKYLNLVVSELKKIEKNEYDVLFESVEKETIILYDKSELISKLIIQIGIKHHDRIIEVLTNLKTELNAK